MLDYLDEWAAQESVTLDMNQYTPSSTVFGEGHVMVTESATMPDVLCLTLPLLCCCCRNANWLNGNHTTFYAGN